MLPPTAGLKRILLSPLTDIKQHRHESYSEQNNAKNFEASDPFIGTNPISLSEDRLRAKDEEH
jgi:hypothetical protein